MDDGSRLPLEEGHVKKKSGIFDKLTHIFHGKQQDAVTEKEIISMVDEAHEKGVLHKDEAEMIQNIFAFEDKEVGAVMTHRSHVAAFALDDLLKDVVEHMMEEGNSRYPVCGEDMDDIRGLIHYKDALKFFTQNSWAKFKPLKELPGLIRKVTFVPETRHIGQLFRTMQARQVHMAVVVDEYGQTAGLVTMEDILEEIVGNILDEHDEEDTYIEKKPDGTFVMNGMTPLEEVGEALNLDFEDEDYDTLNGLLISLIDKIPSEHEVFEVKYKGYIFEVLSVEDKMIKYVHVVPETEESAESDTATCQQDEKMVE